MTFSRAMRGRWLRRNRLQHHALISRATPFGSSQDPAAGPPSDAMQAVRKLLVEVARMTAADATLPRRTKVDGHLLEAWRLASSDPDDEVARWLRDGAQLASVHNWWTRVYSLSARDLRMHSLRTCTATSSNSRFTRGRRAIYH